MLTNHIRDIGLHHFLVLLAYPSKIAGVGRVDVTRMEQKYLKSDLQQDGLHTQIYQAVLLNKVFAFPLNIVVVLKTNLRTRKRAHIILFSTDLELSHEKIVDYYTLRFQIEFNVRDAKQYWGLDDFMNIKKTSCYKCGQFVFLYGELQLCPVMALSPTQSRV